MRLIYISPVPLNSFAQRPHHFVHWFHQRFNCPVLWVEPYPARLPNPEDLRRLWHPRPVRSLGPDWMTQDWLDTLHVCSIPLEPLSIGRRLNSLLWRDALRRIDDFITPDALIIAAKPCQFAITLARRYPNNVLVLDVMDHVPAFTSGRSARWLARAEEELAARARWILSSSTALHEKLSRFGTKRRLVRNGLARIQPGRAATVSSGPFVLGFIGTLASWFDWDAVIRLATEIPESQIVLIGPCDAPPARLPPNVHLKPPIPQNRVYEAIRGFSIGLIPFKNNELTEFVDPVKYYEYRALGIPVLSTRFGEMRLRGKDDCVFFIEDAHTSAQVRQIGLSKPDAAATAAFIAANQWDVRFNALDIFQDHAPSAPCPQLIMETCNQ